MSSIIHSRFTPKQFKILFYYYYLPFVTMVGYNLGRNSIIVTPHPRTKLTNKLIVDLLRENIVKMGAPADLVIR